MERYLLVEQLTRTEQHLSADAQRVLRQQSIIDELERRGEDSSYARAVLGSREEMQAIRVADRDRMRAALQQDDSSGESE